MDLALLKCSCTIFAHQGRCDHLDLAGDIYFHKGKKFRFLIYSAFHKEVRRSDILLGTNWANVVQIISGESGLIKYCHKICFEECRNISLFYDLISQSQSGIQLAQRLILSIKKWELKSLPNHMQNWVSCYERYLFSPNLIMENFLHPKTIIDAYLSWFYFKDHKGDRGELRDLFDKEHTDNEMLSDFLSRTGNSGYEFMVALELSLGIMDLKEINHVKESKPIGTLFIPRFEVYIEDVHTWTGKRLLKKHFDKFMNDEDLEGTGLDLRYSGLITSGYKREIAFERGKQGWSWDKVKIERIKIKDVMALEKLFYSSLFSSSKKK